MDPKAINIADNFRSRGTEQDAASTLPVVRHLRSLETRLHLEHFRERKLELSNLMPARPSERSDAW
jgi:hypothetical protein